MLNFWAVRVLWNFFIVKSGSWLYFFPIHLVWLSLPGFNLWLCSIPHIFDGRIFSKGFEPEAAPYVKQHLKLLGAFGTKWSIKNAAIAPWFCLCLPFCGPGLNPTHYIPSTLFFNLYYWNCNEKRTKINKKRPGLAHFFLKKTCPFIFFSIL